MYKHVFLGTFIALTLAACQSEYRNIRDYYYPVLEQQSGEVYAYDLTMNGQTIRDYWYFRGFVRDSGLFLSSTNYDEQFRINQISRERIDETGAVNRDYFVYEQDSATHKSVQTAAVVESPDVFPFRVKDSLGVFLFNLHYRPAGMNEAKLYLIRNRYFLGDAPDFEFNGKKYPCIRMGVREAIGNESEGASEIEGKGEEWYAKGIGLVYFKKTYGDKEKIVREYRLRERFDMTELERRAGKSFGQ